MSKIRKKASIISSIEDGVTVYEIYGVENDLNAYKRAYSELMGQIQKNMMNFVVQGRPVPIIRTKQSMEVH